MYPNTDPDIAFKRIAEARIQSNETESESELEKIVKQMAQRIVEYRASLPDQLKSTLVSILVAQRPIEPDFSELGTSGVLDWQGGGEKVISSEVEAQIKEDKDSIEKIQLLKARLSSNVSVMSTTLKRMTECISAIK